MSESFKSIRDFEWLSEDNELHYLDRKHGIDALCELISGQTITIQAKVLTKLEYYTVTIEGESDTDEGDWHTMLAQFIVIVYSGDGTSI